MNTTKRPINTWKIYIYHNTMRIINKDSNQKHGLKETLSKKKM